MQGRKYWYSLSASASGDGNDDMNDANPEMLAETIRLLPTSCPHLEYLTLPAGYGNRPFTQKGKPFTDAFALALAETLPRFDKLVFFKGSPLSYLALQHLSLLPKLRSFDCHAQNIDLLRSLDINVHIVSLVYSRGPQWDSVALDYNRATGVSRPFVHELVHHMPPICRSGFRRHQSSTNYVYVKMQVMTYSI